MAQDIDWEALARARGWRIDNFMVADCPNRERHDVFAHEEIGCAFPRGRNTPVMASEGWKALCDAENIRSSAFADGEA